MRGKGRAAVVTLGLLVAAALPAWTQTAPAVAVVNFTKYTAVAQNALVPAGQTVRFNVDARNYSRVSLLVAGETRPDAGPLGLVTLFGPPLVPGGEPHRLPAGPDGRIGVSFIRPVLGPAMVIAIHNDSAADAQLSIGAYLSN